MNLSQRAAHFSTQLLLALVATAAVLSITTPARAYEDTYIPRTEKPLEPSKKYQGRTPDDLTNGLLFDNGTFGLRNPGYESWSDASNIVPGVSTLVYPYRDKEHLVAELESFAQFVDDAIGNWRSVTDLSLPEGKAHGQEAAATMQPLLDKFREQIKRTSGSSQSDWEKNSSDAQHELASINAAYSNIHKNVH